MSDAELIERVRNPKRHGDDSQYCPACFGSCAGWPGDWVEDAEELARELADALERHRVTE